jgi:hypothetical protein
LGLTWQEGVIEADMIERVKRALKGEVDLLGRITEWLLRISFYSSTPIE